MICLAASNAVAAPCAQSGAGQDAWVNQEINALVRAARAAYEDDRADTAYEKVVAAIAGTLERCKLGEDRDFVGRYPEFVAYVKLLSLARDQNHELGFEVSDKIYFTETSSYTNIPDFLLSPRFLKAVSRFENLPRAKALLREMNTVRAPGEQLLFFSYESRHLGTPDNPNSFRRLLIVVPGHPEAHVPEKWVQFGIPDPRRPASVRNVSVVAVAPGANETTSVYFKDFYRTYHRDGSITIKGRWELGEGDDNCVSCHKSGVLPIFPVRGSVTRDELPMVDVVNERFRDYGPARFDKYIDTTKFGPSLGSIRPGTSPESRIKTAECNSCHRANDMGPLNWPMDSTIINSFVTGGQMPLGASLNRRERELLYRRLVTDYFALDETRPGILKAWLLGKDREPAAAN